MNDFYTEQLIKKQRNMKDIMKIVLLVVLAAASVFFVFLIPMAIIVPVIVIAVVFILIRRMDVEYEYLYVNGDLDIDKIMHKERRKKLFSSNVDNMELLAPERAEELKNFRNAKVLDYTSGVEGARRYVFVAKEKGELVKVVFEPNDDIIEGIFLLAPRKVVREK